MMWVRLAPVKDGVSQTLDLILHVLLGSNAERGSLSGEHILENLQILFDTVLTVLRFDSLVSLKFHLFSRCVISIGKSLFDERLRVVLNLVEVVGRVGHLIGCDVQGFEIAGHVLGKLDLFVHGVGVVEAENHFALVHASVVIVHKSGLAVTDVEVTRGFGREASHNLTHLGPL